MKHFSRRKFINITAFLIAIVIFPVRAFVKKKFEKLKVFIYPPLLQGLRGQHPGSNDVAHSLAWQKKTDWGPIFNTEEQYDLAVVGAGISGLASAFFYQQKYPDAKIIIFDNHDDFGGHAKRNEFHYKNKIYLGYGGTQSIENPCLYSSKAQKCLADLDIDTKYFEQAYDKNFLIRNKLHACTYFSKQFYNENKLLPYVVGDLEYVVPYLPPSPLSYQQGIEEMPLEASAKQQLLRVIEMSATALKQQDALHGKSYAKNTLYFTFLKQILNVDHPQVLHLLRDISLDSMAMGLDVLSVNEAMKQRIFGLPFEEESTKYVYHFPDGNASIARLIVRKLIPDVATGDTMHDIITSRFDYHKLDMPHHNICVRLNSTVTNVSWEDNHNVTIQYVNSQQAYKVQAKKTVLACFNAIIPDLAPQLPPLQQQALKQATRIPLVYSTVLLRNWRAFKNLGIAVAYCPGFFYSHVFLDFPIKHKNYQTIGDVDEPTTITMIHAASSETYGMPPREQFREERYRLLSMKNEDYNSLIDMQLTALLSPGGFETKNDILAITNNRWAHGYAYWGSDIFDPIYSTDKAPYYAARQPFGPIHIANSDAEANAFTNCAIDQASKAIDEIINTKENR